MSASWNVAESGLAAEVGAEPLCAMTANPMFESEHDDNAMQVRGVCVCFCMCERVCVSGGGAGGCHNSHDGKPRTPRPARPQAFAEEHALQLSFSFEQWESLCAMNWNNNVVVADGDGDDAVEVRSGAHLHGRGGCMSAARAFLNAHAHGIESKPPTTPFQTAINPAGHCQGV